MLVQEVDIYFWTRLLSHISQKTISYDELQAVLSHTPQGFLQSLQYRNQFQGTKCSLWQRTSRKQLLHCISPIVAKIMWQMPSGITMRFLHKSHSLWTDSSWCQLVKILGPSPFLATPSILHLSPANYYDVISLKRWIKEVFDIKALEGNMAYHSLEATGTGSPGYWNYMLFFQPISKIGIAVTRQRYFFCIPLN